MVAVVLALPVIAANMESQNDLENDLDHIFAIHHHNVN